MSVEVKCLNTNALLLFFTSHLAEDGFVASEKMCASSSESSKSSGRRSTHKHLEWRWSAEVSWLTSAHCTMSARSPSGFAQEFWPCPGGRVLLHVLHKAVAFGVARKVTVHQETAFNVAIGAHQLLKLGGSDCVGHVGDTQERVRGLKLDGDVTASDWCLVQSSDGILCLVTI